MVSKKYLEKNIMRFEDIDFDKLSVRETKMLFTQGLICFYARRNLKVRKRLHFLKDFLDTYGGKTLPSIQTLLNIIEKICTIFPSNLVEKEIGSLPVELSIIRMYRSERTFVEKN